jgi:hypothetical protein
MWMSDQPQEWHKIESYLDINSITSLFYAPSPLPSCVLLPCPLPTLVALSYAYLHGCLILYSTVNSQEAGAMSNSSVTLAFPWCPAHSSHS